jgi:hypothetical protein
MEAGIKANGRKESTQAKDSSHQRMERSTTVSGLLASTTGTARSYGLMALSTEGRGAFAERMAPEISLASMA